MIRLLKQTNSIVWTGDGSEVSNLKINRAYNALAILEQSSDISILNRTVLVYNKFSNKSSTTVSGADLRNIGGAPRYEHATIAQVLERLSPMEMLDKLD